MEISLSDKRWVSPDQSQAAKNILHCLKHETQMGWLIDSDEKTVFVSRPKQETEVFDELDQVLPMPSFISGLEMSIENLFA